MKKGFKKIAPTSSTERHDTIQEHKSRKHMIEETYGKNARFVNEGKKLKNRIWPITNENKSKKGPKV